MTDAREISERLRDRAANIRKYVGFKQNAELDEKAADLIEQQAAEIERLQDALRKARTDALEEAAKVADAHDRAIMSSTTADMRAVEIATATRTLKDNTNG